MTEIAQRVAKFLNRAGDAEVVALAESHAAVVTMFVKNYVRGHGFDAAGTPTEDLKAVIITATARFIVNPAQAVREQIGDQNILYSKIEGFSLVEQAVLHRYRRRAA